MENEQKIIPMKLGNLPSRNMTLIERLGLENRIKCLERQLQIQTERAEIWQESSNFWSPRARAYEKLLEENGIEIPLELMMSFPRFNPRSNEIK